MAIGQQIEFSAEADADLVQEAMRERAGLPLKGSYANTKRGKAADISDTPGAGWTTDVVDVHERSDGNRWAIPVTNESRPHLGRTVRVRGQDVAIPAESTAVNPVGMWRQKRRRGVAGGPGPRRRGPSTGRTR